MKTLAEIAPRVAVNAANTPGDATSLFKIIQPGSYYLTGNITGVSGKHGIVITASGVTLDLNGFDLVGIAGMGVFDGVSVTVANLNNIAVINGSVRNWGDDGIDLGTFPATNCRVAGLLVSGNSGSGILFSSGTATNCSSDNNGNNGINAGSRCVIANCSASSNSGSGITTSSSSAVTNCVSNSNTDFGIFAGNGCAIANCVANSNIRDGIDVGSGSSIIGCTARSNSADGILCVAACSVRENTSTGNGSGAGIQVNANNNRIEGNHVSSNAAGISVGPLATGNLIIRNHAVGNAPNYNLPPSGNFIGTVVSTSAEMNAAPNATVNISF